jgi:23S rRNA pseudouridine2457 synthase
MAQTFIIYKPYGMLSQFTQDHPGQSTLADLAFSFPRDVYPVGRLDADSEGLLLLSNDKSLNQQLLHPDHHVQKTYWVQVEGIPNDSDLQSIRQGLTIQVNGKPARTKGAKAHVLSVVPELPPRVPPIRVRLTVPDTWISITIEEGKNRQVRKMCAAIGFPVLRLVRVAFGSWQWGETPIGQLMPGEVCMLP